MHRKATVLWNKTLAGILSETEDGYMFQYSTTFLESTSKHAVSLTLPLRDQPFISRSMFSFFDGLIPEGWLLDVARRTWKLDQRDRMGLLLTCCRDCIGAVSLLPEGSKSK